MTKREQYLVIGVAGVAGLLGIQMVVSSIRSGLTAKQQTLDALIAKIEGHDRVNTSGALAGKRLNELKAKSLPANEGLATNQYTTWLREIAAEAGVENIGTEKRFALRGNTFASYQFQLKGDMRLDGLVKLLHSYYQRDCLHRIASLKVTQTPNDPDWVSILLTSEALSLNSASAKQEPSKALSNRVTKSFEEYQDEILGRNPFGPPNQAPKISVATSHDVPRGREWSLDLKATDPDGRHWIDFYLPAELPKGLQFNPESGKISWQPETNGNYELLVQAVDNGFPRKWTEQKLTLKVVDPPAPPPPAVEAPKFDPATQSFVSAILSGRSGAQAWIRSKTDNNTYKVAAGDEIAIGTVKGKVIEVNVDQQFIEIESDGRHWTLGMDDSLQAAYKKSKAD